MGAGRASWRGRSLNGIPADRVVAVACTGQWASTVPVDEAGEPVGPCVMWMRHARRATLARRHRRARCRATRRARWRPGSATPAASRRPSAATRSATCCTWSATSPTSRAAARWYLEPVDYLSDALHRRRGGLPRLDDRRLAHRQPAPRPAGLRPGARAAGRARCRASCRRWSQTGSVIGAVRPEVAAELGICPSAQVVTGMPDLHSAALGCGAIGEGETHISISTTAWICCPFPRKKTDRSARSRPCRGSDSSALPPRQQPRGGRALPALAAGRASPSTSRRATSA